MKKLLNETTLKQRHIGHLKTRGDKKDNPETIFATSNRIPKSWRNLRQSGIR